MTTPQHGARGGQQIYLEDKAERTRARGTHLAHARLYASRRSASLTLFDAVQPPSGDQVIQITGRAKLRKFAEAILDALDTTE